ncbi:MAG: AbrB/MazE/SpoVT family DNA-binding domain-containing protein [Candidatus Saccharimonas sp.]|nr:AbrB/MazE/SpoVT family DNA-binding domain-containing protein [Planctomycetaceae bacterium]
MKSLEAKLLQIGNARGIRLPAAMIRKHQLDAGVVLEERDGEIVLRSKQATKKLSWEETAQQMAAASEDWSDWEAVADGWNGE